jgi:dTDP-4-amino-4,6-dideoxygalactose transaminase
LYPVQIILESITKSRKQVFNELKCKNIGVNIHYIPIHTQPYYQKFGFKMGDFPNSEKFYSRSISLPLHPNITKEQQDKIVKSLGGILS